MALLEAAGIEARHHRKEAGRVDDCRRGAARFHRRILRSERGFVRQPEARSGSIVDGGSVEGTLDVDRALEAGRDASAGAGRDGGPGSAVGERVSEGRQGEDGGGDAGDSTPAGCDPGPDGGERSSDAAGPAGAVDCVRERGEPDARGCHGTAAGGGHQAGDRGAARTIDPRVPVGERGAVRSERRLRVTASRR